jgi:hypothetical protein
MMNPLRAWRFYRSMRRLVGVYEEAKVSKNFWKSKTIWMNVLSAAVELTGLLPIPAGTTVIIVNVLNIALRFVTSEPVHLIHPDE